MARSRAILEFVIPASGLALLHFVAVPDNPVFHLCGFQWLTGIRCPFCGMTRALFALGKGHWERAIAFHPLSPIVFVALVTLAVLGLIRLLRPGCEIPPLWKARFLNASLILFAAVGVFRVVAAR